MQRRKNGSLRKDAIKFGNAAEIQSDYTQMWPEDDIEDVVRELSRKNMLLCRWGDNTFKWVLLTDAAIIHMENRFGNNLDRLLQRITDIKSALLI